MNILLICSAGVSTTVVVERMRKSAAEKGIPAEIKSTSAAEYQSEPMKADVIMLGPQVRYLTDSIQKQTKDTPVVIIDMVNYGSLDGEQVLNQALKAVGK